MKKFLFAVAALATSLTASAQLWVSGGLSFGNQSEWTLDDSRTTWSITPTIGYALDDALEVGLEFGIGGYSNGKKYYNQDHGDLGERSNINFSIAPFARYTFISEGNFSMFIQGKVGYTYNNNKKTSTTKDPLTGDNVETTTESKTWQFDFGIEPGIKYAFTDNFAMAATLGGLYFSHNDPEKASIDEIEQNKFGLKFNTALNLSLVYSF